MAKHLGLEWPRDRQEIIEKINEMRLEIRNRFPDASIFRECAYVVPIFKMEDLSGSYPGFTLPEEMASLTATWVDGDSTVLRSRWRERHTGILSHSALELQVVPMMHTSPTEADLSGPGQTLQVRSYFECDDNKKVEVTVRVGRKLKKITFPLNSLTWKTSKSKITRIERVVLPPDLCGPVTMRELSGRVLSIYHPGVEVPSYQRYKIASSPHDHLERGQTARSRATGFKGNPIANTTSDAAFHCLPDHVIITGPKTFREVFADDDIVEIGDLAVLRHAASYLRYQENTTDAGDLRRAQYDQARMREHLNGVMARLDGEQTEDTNFPSPRVTRPRTRLKGYRKR